MKLYVFHLNPGGVLPKITPELGKAVKEGIASQLQKNPGVEYHGTMYDPTTGKAICEWEAPSSEVVAKIFKELSVPFDEVVPVEPLKL